MRRIVHPQPDWWFVGGRMRVRAPRHACPPSPYLGDQVRSDFDQLRTPPSSRRTTPATSTLLPISTSRKWVTSCRTCMPGFRVVTRQCEVASVDADSRTPVCRPRQATRPRRRRRRTCCVRRGCGCPWTASHQSARRPCCECFALNVVPACPLCLCYFGSSTLRKGAGSQWGCTVCAPTAIMAGAAAARASRGPHARAPRAPRALSCSNPCATDRWQKRKQEPEDNGTADIAVG
jgi:hypothetical protein